MAEWDEPAKDDEREPLAQRVLTLEKQLREMREHIEELNASARQFARELGLDGR